MGTAAIEKHTLPKQVGGVSINLEGDAGGRQLLWVHLSLTS